MKYRIKYKKDGKWAVIPGVEIMDPKLADDMAMNYDGVAKVVTVKRKPIRG